MSQAISQYLAIDEEGYPLLGEIRVNDATVGSQILREIKFADNGAFVTNVGGTDAYVEAFDEPLVAQMVAVSGNGWEIVAAYDTRFEFEISTLTCDEWDRFHGLTKGGIPFVLSRKAQAHFFELVDEFDDDSVTFTQKKYIINPWLPSRKDIHSENYWSQIYKTETPRWELNQPAPALVDMLPRLKLPKSRVLILGCGSGNDAALFAENGHVVTAVDISPEAIARGKQKYSHLSNLSFIESDLFKLSTDHFGAYDVIFEHTCYCAINPSQRNDLVKQWIRLLAPGGSLMGVFFAMERRSDPPFGGSEWELRERLKKNFQFIFWGRWRQSMDRRNGKELFIYAQKKQA